MNTFDLRFLVEPPSVESGEPQPLLAQQIWVDGEQLREPHPVSVVDLVESLAAPGEFDIFTCGCGVAACARIDEGVRVRHEPGLVRWGFRRPVSAARKGQEPLSFDAWKASARWTEYAFDRQQMIRALDRALSIARLSASGTTFSPYGFERKDLERLSPGKPYRITSGQGRKALYFLLDEGGRLMFEGDFVAASDLGLSSTFQDALSEWQSVPAQTSRTSPASRLHWLETSRSLVLSAFTEGLAEDIDIRYVFHRWGESGRLDPWEQEIRPLSRRALNPQRTLDGRYLCVSADDYGFCAWLSESVEPQDFRTNFLACGRWQSGELLIPFTLERDLALWGLPHAQPWAFERTSAVIGPAQVPKTRLDRGTSDPESFRRLGIDLTRRLGGALGAGKTAFYEDPWDMEREESPRRYPVPL